MKTSEEVEMDIKLVPITDDNVWDVYKMSVSKHQEDFVAPNDQSLIEAYVTLLKGENVHTFAINQGDTPVGFVMLGYGAQEGDPEIAKDNYLIWRFMIDQEYQGKGYGKQALHEIIKFIKSFPNGEAKACWLSYEPENTFAKKFYASFGFEETGEICDDELVAVLSLNS